MQIVDFRRLQAVAEIYPGDQQRVKVGQRLEIEQDGRRQVGNGPGKTPAADPQTGAIEARADIANPDRELKADMPVTARIAIGEKDALVVPKSALLPEEGHFIVFVQKGGQFEKRSVEAGIRADDGIEIVEGLEDGEKVVTRGAYQLKNMSFSSAPAAGDEEEE